MSLLQTIESKLSEIMPDVFYGAVSEKENITLWDYIVFWRDHLRRNDNRTGYSDYYTVNIVCENWVEDEKIDEVIEKMESISGMRLAEPDIGFSYTVKPSTNAVIEIATLLFCRPRKAGASYGTGETGT